MLPLLAWGYHTAHGRWLRACQVWQKAGLPVANPPAVLAWNSDKRYLQRLAARGVALPATTFTDAVTQAQIDAFFDARAPSA